MVDEQTSVVHRTALAAFSGEFQAGTVLWGRTGYDAARIVCNAMIDRRPAIVLNQNIKA